MNKEVRSFCCTMPGECEEHLRTFIINLDDPSDMWLPLEVIVHHPQMSAALLSITGTPVMMSGNHPYIRCGDAYKIFPRNHKNRREFMENVIELKSRVFACAKKAGALKMEDAPDDELLGD